MTPRPPNATLFPYTTLFRSDAVTRFIQTSVHAQKRCVCIVHGRGLHSETGTSALRGPVREALRKSAGVLARWKSTRLNSSHSSISYAVFCLKKKKKTQLTCG